MDKIRDLINNAIIEYMRVLFSMFFSIKTESPLDMFDLIPTNAKALNKMSMLLDKQNIGETTGLIRNVRNILSNSHNKRHYRKIKRLLNDIECHIKPDTTIHNIILKVFDLYNIINEACIYQDSYTVGLKKFHEKHAYQNILQKYGKENNLKYDSFSLDSVMSALCNVTNKLVDMDKITATAEKATAAAEKATDATKESVKKAKDEIDAYFSDQKEKFKEEIAKNGFSNPFNGTSNDSGNSNPQDLVILGTFDSIDGLKSKNTEDDKKRNTLVSIQSINIEGHIRRILMNTLDDVRNILKGNNDDSQTLADIFCTFQMMDHLSKVVIKATNEYDILIEFLEGLIPYMKNKAVNIKKSASSYYNHIFSDKEIAHVLINSALFTVEILGLSNLNNLVSNDTDLVRYDMCKTVYKIIEHAVPVKNSQDPYWKYINGKILKTMSNNEFIDQYKNCIYKGDLSWERYSYQFWVIDIFKQYTVNKHVPMTTIIKIYEQVLLHTINKLADPMVFELIIGSNSQPGSVAVKHGTQLIKTIIEVPTATQSTMKDCYRDTFTNYAQKLSSVVVIKDLLETKFPAESNST